MGDKFSASYRFSKIDSREKAYCLGYILANGTISGTNVIVASSLHNKQCVEFISTVIGGNTKYDKRINKKFGIFPNITLTTKIPDLAKFTGGRLKKDRHYPRVRTDLERYLIQGLFDADGCLTWGRRKDKNRIWQKVVFTSQLKILLGVQQYLQKHLAISTSVRPKAKEDCYILEFSNRNDVMKFCNHIYPDEKFIILNRKYLKYKALRLELEENGESGSCDRQCRAESAEQKGVETSGDAAMHLNDRNSIQGCNNCN